MVLYGVRLLINIFDLCIYRRFLEVFIGKRKTPMEVSFILLVACEIVGSAINQLGINWLNLLTLAVILSIYICQYSSRMISKAVAILLYMGITVITEPIGYLCSKTFMAKLIENEVVIYYFTAFVMVVIHAVVVEIFCRLKLGKNIRPSVMPKDVLYMLAVIPLASLVSCFLLIEVSQELISEQMIVLCMCIIFTILAVNYILFLMIEKYTMVEERQHEEEMMQAEAAYRNEYYCDMELYQEQIHDIRHDMKNRLAGLLDAAEHGESVLLKEKLQEMLGEIRQTEDIMYSANPVLNSILKVKGAKAKEKGICFEVYTLIPQKVSIEIGDMGILFGNLLDNAIEACCKVEQDRRFITVEIKYQEGKLLLQMKNSKQPEENPTMETTKANKWKHGRGIRSVRRVAEKYGGNLILHDNGNEFETNLLLMDVKKLA